MKPTLVVMAAGMGSRYGGLKQIDPVGPAGEIMLDYAVFDAARSGFGRAVFIIRPDIEEAFRAVVDRHIARAMPVSYVHQTLDKLPPGYRCPEGRAKPWGTGHAILCAEPAVREPFAVINADDYYGLPAYQRMAGALARTAPDKAGFFLAGYRLSDTLSEHGSVSRGVCEVAPDGDLLRVVERTHIERTPSGAVARTDAGPVPLSPETVVSMNFWGFTPALFPHLRRAFEQFLRDRGGDQKAELAIPTIVDQLLAGRRASVRVLPASSRWLGMTYTEDKPLVRAGIRQLIGDGVYPAPLWSSGSAVK